MNQSYILLTLSLHLLALLSGLTEAKADTQKVVILPIKHTQNQATEEIKNLTTFIRSAANRLLIKDYSIINQDDQSLSADQQLKDCFSGISCGLNAGRKLGADYVITSEMTTFEDEYRINIQLHQIKSTQRIAKGLIRAKKISDLKKPLQAETLKLLSKLDTNLTQQAEWASEGIVYEKVELFVPYEGKKIEFTPLSKITIDPTNPKAKDISGIDFNKLDKDLIKAYNFAVDQDQSEISETEKYEAWKKLLEIATDHEGLKRLSTECMEIWQVKIGQISFNETLDYDEMPIDAEKSSDQAIKQATRKIDKWRSLAENHPTYQNQAKQRINEWENWIIVENERETHFTNTMSKMTDLEDQRRLKRDESWDDLLNRLNVQALPDSEKKKHVIAFVIAYGALSTLNPYVDKLKDGELKAYLPAEKIMTSIMDEDLNMLEERLNVLLNAPKKYQWKKRELKLWKVIPFSLLKNLGDEIINEANIPDDFWYANLSNQKVVKHLFEASKVQTDFPILPLFRLLYTYCPSCTSAKNGIGFDYQIGYHFLKFPKNLVSIGAFLDSAFFGYFANDSNNLGSLHFYTIPTIKVQKQEIMSNLLMLYYGFGIGLGYHTYSQEVIISKKDNDPKSYQINSLAYKAGLMFGVRSIKNMFSLFQVSLDLLGDFNSDFSSGFNPSESIKNCSSCLYKINPIHVQLGFNLDLLGLLNL